MAWIRIGEDIKRTRIYRAINANMGKGDHCNGARFAILIQIFLASANGVSWGSAGDLAQDLACNAKQASIVWDLCIQHGVLAGTPDGYSADQWLRAQGMLGSAKDAREAREPKRADAPAPIYNAEPPSFDIDRLINQRLCV